MKTIARLKNPEAHFCSAAEARPSKANLRRDAYLRNRDKLTERWREKERKKEKARYSEASLSL